MSAGFTDRQLKRLATPLDRTRVQTREQDGKTLSYIEGWFAIQEANRIFGYDGWDREMVHFERSFERHRSDGASCGYVARVRVRVRAKATTITREGTGFGQATAATLGDAQERALKAAETDATKRALATFGGRFGLSLYDKEGGKRHDSAAETKAASAETRRSVPVPKADDAERWSVATPLPPDDFGHPSPDASPEFRVIAPDGSVIEDLSAEAFCTALRQLIEAVRDRDELARLRHDNFLTVTRLRRDAKLKTARGQHYADVLLRLFADREAALAKPTDDGRSALAAPPSSDMPSAREPDASAGGSSLPRSAYKPFMPVPAYPLAEIADLILKKVKERWEAGQEVDGSPRGGQSSPTYAEPGSELDLMMRARERAAVLDITPSQTRFSAIALGPSIDKSVLRIASDRRLRHKAHMAFVASKACVICQEMPCHAHHVTFAQPRGLSLKVSDEFTVPLCVKHHNELHLSGSEIVWWRSQGIDPLAIARALWEQTMESAAPESGASDEKA